MPVPQDAYADFCVPLGERQKRKREVFRKYGFRVIELGEEDLAELDDRLPGRLLRYLPEGYRFR